MGDNPSADSDEDIYTNKYEWGTLFMDESDRIFQQIVNTVGGQYANISHDFSITA